jgi:hypothetical protein
MGQIHDNMMETPSQSYNQHDGFTCLPSFVC